MLTNNHEFLTMLTKFKLIKLLPLLLTIIGVSILLLLGFWQLNRLQAKNLLITTITNNLSSPPVSLSSVSQQPIYCRIKLNGHFLTNKDIHLYGRRASSGEKDGYNLLTPFKTDDNKVIMVARGWFAASNKATINSLENPLQEEIVGIALQAEKKHFFLPNNDQQNNIWLTLDLEEISKVLGLSLERFYLLQTDIAKPRSNIKPLSAQNLLHIRNDHLEYAITWFSLAFGLGVIFIIYQCKLSKGCYEKK